MKSEKTVIMTETAFMASLAYVLSFVEFGGFWAQGGSISLVMIPIVFLSFRRGIKAGITAGLLVGLIKAMIGGYIVHPVQFILDYPLAFAVLGLAGVFGLNGKTKGVRMIQASAGILLAASARLMCHVISGIVWFGSYAPEGINVTLYSFLYNVSYLLPEVIINSILLVFLITSRQNMLIPQVMTTK